MIIQSKALDDDAFDAEANVEEDVVDEDFDVPEDPKLDTEVLGEEKEVKKKVRLMRALLMCAEKECLCGPKKESSKAGRRA